MDIEWSTRWDELFETGGLNLLEQKENGISTILHPRVYNDLKEANANNLKFLHLLNDIFRLWLLLIFGLSADRRREIYSDYKKQMDIWKELTSKQEILYIIATEIQTKGLLQEWSHEKQSLVKSHWYPDVEIEKKWKKIDFLTPWRYFVQKNLVQNMTMEVAHYTTTQRNSKFALIVWEKAWEWRDLEKFHNTILFLTEKQLLKVVNPSLTNRQLMSWFQYYMNTREDKVIIPDNILLDIISAPANKLSPHLVNNTAYPKVSLFFGKEYDWRLTMPERSCIGLPVSVAKENTGILYLISAGNVTYNFTTLIASIDPTIILNCFRRGLALILFPGEYFDNLNPVFVEINDPNKCGDYFRRTPPST